MRLRADIARSSAEKRITQQEEAAAAMTGTLAAKEKDIKQLRQRAARRCAPCMPPKLDLRKC